MATFHFDAAKNELSEVDILTILSNFNLVTHKAIASVGADPDDPGLVRQGIILS